MVSHPDRIETFPPRPPAPGLLWWAVFLSITGLAAYLLIKGIAADLWRQHQI
jgi:hypothetical protein